MKTHHEKNLGIMTCFAIGCYVVWYFFYYIRETLYRMKQEGKLRRMKQLLQSLFALSAVTFVITSINFLDNIIAKETFFCQEGLILLYIYCFVLVGWFLSKVYLETEKEHHSFIDNMFINFVGAFIFSEYIYSYL